MDIPKEPNKYTTVYGDFKGVDYTNDLTNVFKRRSPDGLNMAPGFDGKPRKRHGWEIAIKKEDFIKVYNNTAHVDYKGEVVPIRTHYFEIGGVDYLAIFNNLGFFLYDGTTLYCVEATQTFDPNRCFFFEGQGEAGFYMFSGLDLYRFDGKEIKKKTPYVPVVLIGTSPTADSATTFEAINLLTPLMSVQYIPDGTASYTIPNGATPGTLKVEIMDNNGAWAATTAYTTVGDPVTSINFTSAPAKATEDRVRITYQPAGITVSTTKETVTRPYVTVTVKHIGYQTRTKYTGKTVKNKAKTAYTAWSATKWQKYTSTNPVFDISGIYRNTANNTYECTPKYKNSLNESANFSDTYYTKDFTSYSNKLSLKIKASTLFTSALHAETNKTAYGSVTANGKSKKYTAQSSINTINSNLKLTGNNKFKKPVTAIPQKRAVTQTKTYAVQIDYTKQTTTTTDSPSTNRAREAFQNCQKAAIFGNGIINQVFMGATTYPEYTSRMWYSMVSDPTYFPDTSYVEVGSTDTAIMGMLKIDEYLGVIKQGDSMDTSIYMAYPTSFQDDTTYAVKQSISGIGAISNGAFNILNSESLFLSSEGIMGIDLGDAENRAKNRSYYINRKLTAEPNLENAVSFVFNGLYLLAVNNHVYVLDGSQKSSWANAKSNLQYECYYWDNIPAQCFARMDNQLYFSDTQGNVCRFKTDDDPHPFYDEYSVDGKLGIAESTGTGEITAKIVNSDGVIAAIDDLPLLLEKWPETGYFEFTYDTGLWYLDGEEAELSEYGISASDPLQGAIIGVVVYKGEYIYGYPIHTVWATIADDDGMPHYYKNLQKKGTMVVLEPSSDSGVEVYFQADDKDLMYIGKTDASGNLPIDFYTKKKVKKYKRLQIICKNNGLLDSFGIDQIVKIYTVGNYSKNR